MKTLSTPLLLLAGCVLFLAGCSGFDRGVTSVGLSVELNGIERAADGTVTVTWSLVNPNVTPYLLERVTQKIFLDGALAGTTLDTQPMAVPAQQTTSKASRLTPAGPAAERLVAEAAAKGGAAYRVETQLLIRLYGDLTDKGLLTHTGSVPVTGK
ncbi:MAG: hypothetical protein HYV75_08535 [Opitutae bacterium]|nr:hypothetical protein [Opitutae bacterium]